MSALVRGRERSVPPVIRIPCDIHGHNPAWWQWEYRGRRRRADSVMRGSYPGSRCLFSSGVRVGLVATEHEHADEEESSEGKEDSMVQQ